MGQDEIRISKTFIRHNGLAAFKTIHRAAFEVLLVLCANSADNKTSRIGLRDIRVATGFSIDSITRALTQLKKLGLVKQLKRERRTDIGYYELKIENRNVIGGNVV